MPSTMHGTLADMAAVPASYRADVEALLLARGLGARPSALWLRACLEEGLDPPAAADLLWTNWLLRVNALAERLLERSRGKRRARGHPRALAVTTPRR